MDRENGWETKINVCNKKYNGDQMGEMQTDQTKVKTKRQIYSIEIVVYIFTQIIVVTIISQ